MALAMKGKTIKQIEREAVLTLQKETELMLDQQQIDHMHDIFEQCKEKIEDTQVHLDEFCTLLAEDEFFNELMEQPVRRPYEGELETLENLMNRMLTDHRGAVISWF